MKFATLTALVAGASAAFSLKDNEYTTDKLDMACYRKTFKARS